MSEGSVNWGALIDLHKEHPDRRGTFEVQGEIKLRWDIWRWRESTGFQWMDVIVVYRVDQWVGRDEMKLAERRAVRLVQGLRLMSAELAPGSSRVDVMNASYRLADGGYHGKVTTVFAEDDLELFRSLERGLLDLAGKLRARVV